MRRCRVVLLMAVGLVAASCGSPESGTFADLEAAAGDVDETSGETDDSGVADRLVIADARSLLDRAASPDASGFEMTMVVEVGGIEDFGGETLSFSVIAAGSADGTTSRFVLDFGEILAASMSASGEAILPAMATAFSEPIEMRQIGETIYMSSSFIALVFPVDAPWVAFDEADPAASDFGMDSFSTEEFLFALRAIGGDPTVVGLETIRGVETTHIRGRLSAEALAEAGDATFFEGLDPTGAGAIDVDEVDIDVWIDADGVLRRMVFGTDDLSMFDPTAAVDSFFLVTIDFASTEGPVAEAPPEEDVAWFEDIFAAFGFDA